MAAACDIVYLVELALCVQLKLHVTQALSELGGQVFCNQERDREARVAALLRISSLLMSWLAAWIPATTLATSLQPPAASSKMQPSSTSTSLADMTSLIASGRGGGAKAPRCACEQLLPQISVSSRLGSALQ